MALPHQWDCDDKLHPHAPKLCCAADCKACAFYVHGDGADKGTGHLLHPTGMPVRIQPSKIHGKGVFARRDIHPGHLIGAYMGEVTYDFDDPKALQMEDTRGAWYAVRGTGPLQYMNHSEEFNAELDAVHVYAVEYIKAGEEITILYSENWLEEEENQDDDPETGDSAVRAVYARAGLELVRLTGGEVIAGHPKGECEPDKPCCLHNPSEHHMRGWRQHWREDRGMMERLCVHGQGHPDPDDRSENRTHGCDGCCRPPRPVYNMPSWV